MRADILASKPTYVETFGGTLEDSIFTPDGKKWDSYVGYDWGVIRESQVQVRDGQLVVSMDKRAEPYQFNSDKQEGRFRGWDTGWVRSKGKLSFAQGAVEVVAKVPNAPGVSAGVWCAGWLRPEDNSLGGEIDFFESFGDLGKEHNPAQTVGYPNRYTATVHFNQAGTSKDGKQSPITPADLSAEFHRYGMVKTDEEIIFYFDREEIHRVTRAGNESRWDKAFPKGAPYYLIFCTQAGSSWWGQPTEETAEHSELVVDQITVWDFDK